MRECLTSVSLINLVFSLDVTDKALARVGHSCGNAASSLCHPSLLQTLSSLEGKLRVESIRWDMTHSTLSESEHRGQLLSSLEDGCKFLEMCVH